MPALLQKSPLCAPIQELTLTFITSQEPGPYPEPDLSSPLPPPSYQIHFNTYVFFLVFLVVYSVIPTKYPICIPPGVATGYGLDYRRVGVRVPVVSRLFPSQRRPDRPWGSPNLLSHMVPGGSSPGVRRSGHEPPANAEVKRIYTSTPPYAFMA
jgi:hypothetical protein